MATQRLSVASFGGQAAVAITVRFQQWRVTANPESVDRLCVAVRENAIPLPVVYFAEWIDRWLMGDRVPGPGVVQGTRFQVACFSPDEATKWADQCGDQFPEESWLAARLREASGMKNNADDRFAILVIREVFGPSMTDEEVRAALEILPTWLVASDPDAGIGEAKTGSGLVVC